MSIFLPDVNVWIGLVVIEHIRHSQAVRWFDSTSTDTLAFCRVTQMGFLRWKVYDVP
jgi:predicted nucleic acid-binding protein